MATNAQRAKERALKLKQEEDPDYVAPVKEKDTKKLVEAAIKSISKDGGVQFTRKADQSLRQVLPTGHFEFDHIVLGAGGFARGRIHEVFGPPSSGKGTITSQLVAETQRLNPTSDNALIDAECAYDAVYASRLKVDTDNLLIAQPTYGEQALQALLDIVTTGGIRLAIIDSVSALVPLAELNGEMTDAHMGLQARMMGTAMRKLVGIVSKTGTCLVFINQIRATMNTGFGAKSDTSGGKALKFYSSTRTSIDRLANYKEKDEVVGSITKLSNKKNKQARPFLETDANLMFDIPGKQSPGFDSHMSLVECAISKGIWTKDGSNYMLASTAEVIKGKANVRDAIRDNKELRKITTEATLVALGKTPDYVKRTMRWL